MSEPQPPNDRELEEFLAHRSAVSQAYRDSFTDAAAPPELDAVIHNAAAAELARSRKRFQRWRLPTALAASLIVALLARELAPQATKIPSPHVDEVANAVVTTPPERVAEAPPAEPLAKNAPAAAVLASPTPEATVAVRRAERRIAPALTAVVPRSEPVPDAPRPLPAAPPVIADRIEKAEKAVSESALPQVPAAAFDRPPPPPPPPPAVLASSVVGTVTSSAASAAVAAPAPRAAAAEQRTDDAARIVPAEAGLAAPASSATYRALLDQHATFAEVQRRYGAATPVLLNGLQTLRYEHLDARGPVRFEFQDGKLRRVMLMLATPRAMAAVLAEEAIDATTLTPLAMIPACAPDALAPAPDDAPYRYTPEGQRLLRVEGQRVTELWWLGACVGGP